MPGSNTTGLRSAAIAPILTGTSVAKRRASGFDQAASDVPRDFERFSDCPSLRGIATFSRICQRRMNGANLRWSLPRKWVAWTDMPEGTLRAILKQAGIGVDDFLRG